MREEDVPQDQIEYYDGLKRACYAVDKNGQYKITKSSGWNIEKIINAQALDELDKLTEITRKQVLRGELSPLAYYMNLTQMTPKLLSANVGIAQWRVKRHLKPKFFNKLNQAILQKYAYIFGLKVEELSVVPK